MSEVTSADSQTSSLTLPLCKGPMMGTEILAFSLLSLLYRGNKATQLLWGNHCSTPWKTLSSVSAISQIWHHMLNPFLSLFWREQGSLLGQLSPKVLEALTSWTSSLFDNGGLYCRLAQRATEWRPCFTALWAQTMPPFHLCQCSPSASGATPLPKHDAALALCSLLRD